MKCKLFTIKKNDTRIIGKWVFDGGQIAGDEQCLRVEWLVDNYLLFITNDASGWNALYKDPEDGRLWERVYLQRELHGGGSPSLLVVGKQRLEDVYGNSAD